MDNFCEKYANKFVTKKYRLRFLESKDEAEDMRTGR